MRWVYLLLVGLFVGCGGTYPRPKEPKKVPASYITELLPICVPDKPDMYGYGSWCDEPLPAIWDHMPLTVGSDYNSVESTINTIEIWNEALGFEAFVYVGLPMQDPDPDVYVFVNDECPPGLNGMAPYFKTETKEKKALVFVCEYERWETLIHEFGHVLGLAHDPDNPRSVMHNYGNTRYLTAIEPLDIEILRYLYKR